MSDGADVGQLTFMFRGQGFLHVLAVVLEPVHAGQTRLLGPQLWFALLLKIDRVRCAGQRIKEHG